MRARWYRMASSALVLLASLLLAGPALGVTITSFAPSNDFIPEDPGNCVGTSVTINGSGFVNDGGPVTVMFNNKPAVDVAIGSDNIIYARMPVGATPGPITVTTAKGTATSTTGFTVAPCMVLSSPALIAIGSSAKATIRTIAPAKAKSGATITISGSNLTGATAVKIGGAAAKFKVVSATKITATVPAKAKSGKVTVTTKAGTATSSTRFTKA